MGDARPLPRSAERNYHMVMVAQAVRKGSVRADLLRRPDDGNRYEVLDGKLLVTPQASYPHQAIAAELIARLRPYGVRHQIGAVVGPGAVIMGPNELQPDVQVIPGNPANLSPKWERHPKPILVVEILSATTKRRDLVDKRK